MGESRLSDVERPRLGDDIYKHPLRTQMVAMDPESGLPRVTSQVTMSDSAAPPLEVDSFVCMGDESAFVIRDVWGNVLISVTPDRVRRFHGNPPYGLEPGWLAQLSDDERQSARQPESVMGGDALWFYVEPLREQCEHYRRVMTDFESDNKHQTVERVCAAQRGNDGEYVALGNTRVYACEHRSPRDFVSEERLRKFDAKITESVKKAEEDWDGDAALEAAIRADGENHNG